jgi:predicted XRE-type DNA-binding protein
MEQGMQAQAMIDGRTKANSKAVIDTVISNPNLTQSEVAKIHGIDRSRVSQICTKYGIDKQELQDFKDNRADIFAHIQKIVTESLTVDDIKKAPVGTRALIACQFYDKERIERGQSIGQDIQINVIQALGDKTKDLRTMLESLSSTQDVVPVIEHDIDNGMSTSINMTKANDINNLDETPSLHNTYYQQSLVCKEAEPVQAQRRRGRLAKGR